MKLRLVLSEKSIIKGKERKAGECVAEGECVSDFSIHDICKAIQKGEITAVEIVENKKSKSA
ncbi:MAG: hypothetical protein WCI77_08040 [Candidatus Omnitrophota bacterium]